ncbi:hypothetical protein [Lysobacter sp. Hz 25]|uniref:hypothetical protein n=1 Tax=Lysobacter sp. Hz 25 TaxID=3383698 RepID=UPI0038D460AF
MTHVPPAPNGFEWRQFSDVFVLKPLGWNERSKVDTTKEPSVDLHATSPETFSETEFFETGFTLQIIRNAGALYSASAEAVASAHLLPFLQERAKEDILLLNEEVQGEIVRMIARYVDHSPGLRPVTVHKFLAVNNTADCVHVFTFESPVETWDENWAMYGETILGNLCMKQDTPANEPIY